MRVRRRRLLGHPLCRLIVFAAHALPHSRRRPTASARLVVVGGGAYRLSLHCKILSPVLDSQPWTTSDGGETMRPFTGRQPNAQMEHPPTISVIGARCPHRHRSIAVSHGRHLPRRRRAVADFPRAVDRPAGSRSPAALHRCCAVIYLARSTYWCRIDCGAPSSSWGSLWSAC